MKPIVGIHNANCRFNWLITQRSSILNNVGSLSCIISQNYLVVLGRCSSTDYRLHYPDDRLSIFLSFQTFSWRWSVSTRQTYSTTRKYSRASPSTQAGTVGWWGYCSLIMRGTVGVVFLFCSNDRERSKQGGTVAEEYGIRVLIGTVGSMMSMHIDVPQSLDLYQSSSTVIISSPCLLVNNFQSPSPFRLRRDVSISLVRSLLPIFHQRVHLREALMLVLKVR